MEITRNLALLLAMGSISVFAGAQTHRLKGWISDAKCGATNHSTACVKKCIAAGSKPVFVDSKNTVWSIDDPDSVQNYYGQHVKVVATVDASNHSIHIDKVKKSASAMSTM